MPNRLLPVNLFNQVIGKLGLKNGGLNTDLSATGPGALWQITNGGNGQAIEPVIIRVKNNSGSTANANEVGLLDYDATYGYSYKTTTTANQDGQWCVVVVGNTNTNDIWVARRGLVTVKLNANCSVGNFLLTSTTAGQASVSTTMRPEVFAVALSANSGGAGGTCTAMLLTGTRFVPTFHTVSLYGVVNHSATNPAPTMTINGAPSATSVVYNAPSSGLADTMVPAAANQLALLILWNSTRSSLRLITAVNTGTKTITTISSTDSWANGDTITTIGQTVGINTVNELDMSGQTIVPLLARSVSFIYGKLSNAAGLTGDIVPYEAFAASKQQIVYTEVANIYTNQPMTVYLINRRFAISLGANGTATDTDTLSLTGYFLAVP